MDWLEVTIKTVSPAIEDLGDALTGIGYDSFIVDDSAEFSEFLRDNTQYWDYVDEELSRQMENVSQIRLYIEDTPQAPDALSQLRAFLAEFRERNRGRDVGTLELSVAGVRAEDWENSWKQYYQPIAVGQRILIVPEWLSPENPEGRLELRLDPGMIFGTGAHASTRMCLNALEQGISGGESVLDLGSGSGILSIAALLLGAKTALAMDIDPKAEDIARENAAINGLKEPEFHALTGNVLDGGSSIRKVAHCKWDVVLANIVADVIIPLAPVVPELMAPNGLFICSGILNTRLGEVLTALDAAGLQITNSREEDDWCCLTAVRR